MDLEYKHKSLIVSFVCCWLPTKGFEDCEKKYCWKVALRQCYNVRKRDSCDEIDTSLRAATLSRYGCGL
jgi:hypothetical protein